MLKQGGTYDFAYKLCEAIGKDKAMLVHLSEQNVPDWEIGPDDCVFLQLSGYGFAKRGAPLWLMQAIEARRKQIGTLGVFFHEIYAFGPPWSSSFWLSPVQRYVSRRIAELSNFWMTSREGSALWLRQYADHKPHAVLPVFSTIGEPSALSVKRLPRIVVFGSAGLRQAAYIAAGNNLFSWANRVAVEIHDIGSPIADVRLFETFNAKGVIVHGHLADKEVRELMSESAYGLLAYPVAFLAKSSVFAAYCAHGICPVLISESYEHADGIVAGTHYLAGMSASGEMTITASVSLAAREWYRSHNVSRHTDTLKNLILKTKV